MAGLTFDIRGDNSDFNQKISEVQTQITNTAKIASDQSAAIDALFGRLSSAAAKFGISLSALGLGNRIMQTRGEFQQLEMAFQTMLGSAEKGQTLMNQLVRTAAVTPFDLKGVANGAKQLLAYGVAAEEVNDTVVKLGDVAAGLSIPLNDLIYVYGTTITQGRMFTQDLRQLQGRGVPIADALAKEMGIAKNAVGDAVTAGKVDAETFKKAMLSLSGAGSQFGGLMDAQSKTITGQIANIEDAIDMMFNDIGKSSEGIINKGLYYVSTLIDNYERVGKILLVAATAFGTYKASLIATQAIEKIKNNSTISGLEEEITKVNEEIAARERLNNTIASKPAEGSKASGVSTTTNEGNQTPQEKISGLQDTLAERQDILNAIKQEEAVEKQAKLNIAATEHSAAQSQLSIAQEKQNMAQSSLALAQQEYDIAVKEKTEAEARVILANQEVDARKVALAQAQKSGDRTQIQNAQSSLDSASFEQEAAYTAQSTAQSNYKNASRNLDTAAEAERTAMTQAQTAAINEQTAAENMHNAAVEKANALNSLNAGETDKATVAARKEVVEIEAKTAALEAEIQRKRELLSMPEGNGTQSNDTSGVSDNPIVAEAQSKLSEQEAINAALDEELQKRVAIAQQELIAAQENYSVKASALDIADQEYIKANDELSIAIKNKEAVDEKVASAKEYLETLKEAADSGDADYDDEISSAADSVAAAIAEQEAAAKEVETAAEAANTAEKDLNTAAEAANTAQTELNTAQTNLNTASQRQQAASEIQSTVATTTNTTVTAGNTVAVQANTLATRASALAGKAWAGVQTLLTGAVTATKMAFNGLKVALATNPFGLAITGVTTLISMLPLLSDLFGISGDEASESSDKFGEAADKTISNVNTLYEVINHSSTESKVYKDAMSELTSICEQYGIQIDKEGNLLDQINSKRKELIGLIQEEGAARIYANGIATAEQDYTKTIDDAQKAMEEGLEGVNDNMKSTFASIFTQSVTGNMDELTAAYNKMEQIKATAGKDWSYSAAGQQAIQEYTDLVNKSTEAVKNSIIADKEKELAAKGVTDENKRHKMALEQTEDAIKNVDSVANTQIKNMIEGNNTYNDRVNALNTAKDATSGLIDATSGLEGEEKRVATQAYLANLKVGDLKTSVQQVLDECKNKHYLDIDVNLNTTNVPDWLKSQMGLNKKGGPSKQDLDYAKNQAAYWTSQLDSMEKKGVQNRKFGDKTLSKEQVAQKAAEYTVGSSMAQEAYDKNANAQPDKKAQAAADKAAKKAAEDAKKRREQQDRSNKAIADENKRWSETEAKNARSNAYEVEQARIDGMTEGKEKTLKQLKLDYQKEKDQIDEEEASLLKAKQEHAKKLWLEKDEKNKNKIFENTDEYKNITLTDEEKAGVNAKRDSAEIKYNKSVQDVYKQEAEAMRNYLKEYGTIQQQRVALIEEWNEKIAQAQTEGERQAARQQMNQAVEGFDNEQIKNGVDWDSLFGDVNNMSMEKLKSVKATLKDMLSNKDLSVEDYQTIVEQIDKVSEALVDAQTKQGLFSNFITDSAKKRLKIENEVVDAIERQNVARAQVAQAQTAKEVAQGGISIRAKEYGLSVGGKESGDIDYSDAQKAIDEATEKYGENSAEVATIKSLFDKLADATKDLTKAMQKASNADKDVENAQDKQDTNKKKTVNEKVGEWAETYSEYDKYIQETNGLVDELGLGNTGLGKAVSGIAGASSNVKGAMEAFASGNYIGALTQGIGAIKDLGNVFGIGNGSNAEEVANKLEELTDRNELLQNAIEDLTDVIENGTPKESLEAYEDAVKAQETVAKNDLEAAKTQGGYHGDHHSWNYYWNGFSDKSVKKIEELIGHSFNNDIWSLTPEEMKKVLQDYDLRKEIENSGKGGYGSSVLEKLDTYAENAGKIEDLTDSINEKINGISFDSFRDNFISALQDMNTSAGDLADDIEEYMWNAFVSNLFTDELDGWMTDFYSRMTDLNKKLANGEITEAQYKKQKEEMQAEADDKSKEVIEKRDQYADFLGYDNKSDSSQDSSYGNVQSLTQDTGEEISGRLTAVQINGEQQLAMQTLILNAINSTISLKTEGNAALNDIRTQTALANSYLSDIQKDTRKIYSEWNEKITRIDKNINDKL